MKFLVCETECGEGCGYYIGCGMKYYFIEADSFEDAQEQVIFPEDESSILESEHQRSEILIMPADNILKVDINSLKAKLKAEKAKEKELASKLAEEKEFERLKNKLGKRYILDPKDIGY